MQPFVEGLHLAIANRQCLICANRLPADVVLGAFAGAILFVVSASDHGIRSRVILAIGSFTAGLMFATGSVAIRIALGAYEGTTDPAEMFINIVLCLLVLRAKGNVVQLFKVKRGGNV
ncbi:putative holin [Yersinia intermedia]|uniref:putative holin n=1 Tax=Yersinia intermedia TaxID=631 RepID=UPI001F52C7E6|nr:putative holin [Yersinia intermedia]MDA5495786.1 phage holin family protein [Yersinia intermedia]UNK22389.1 phage holin family protein [Yersinia intermedia]